MLANLVVLPPAALAEARLHVPSGQYLLPYEALWEDHTNEGKVGETWLVLRFLAPDIMRDGGKISFAAALPDMAYLCKKVGLALVAATGGGVDQIIVTLLDQPAVRGMRNKNVTKFMNAFRVVDGTCKWE